MIGGIAQSAGMSPYEILRSRQKEQEDLQAAPVAEAAQVQASTSASSSNMMAGNFAQSGAAVKSKYIESSLGAASTLKQLQNSFNASMASIASALKGDNPLEQTGGMRRARHNQSIYEASQVNLDEIQQDIKISLAKARAESKAEAEAQAREVLEEQGAKSKPVLKDENGEPVLDATGEPIELAGGGEKPVVLSGGAPADSSAPEVDISTEELEARNIKINLGTSGVKIDIKI